MRLECAWLDGGVACVKINVNNEREHVQLQSIPLRFALSGIN